MWVILTSRPLCGHFLHRPSSGRFPYIIEEAIDVPAGKTAVSLSVLAISLQNATEQAVFAQNPAILAAFCE